MAFDGIVTKAIVTELQKEILGSKIDKIYEPDKNTIILGLYSPGKHNSLNICIDAHNCRINLTTHSRINPQVAPNFCMLLRKHLIGGRISKISMLGLERLVQIEIETINEFNEIEIKTLIVELMGRHSNIILIKNDNTIIDAMRHISLEDNSYRDIIPSRKYTLPTNDKIEITTIENFEEFYSKLDKGDLVKSISNTYTGISQGFIKNAIEEVGIENNDKQDIEKLYNYIKQILDNIGNLKFKKIQAQKEDYVLSLNGEKDVSLNSYIDDFYFERETSETFKNSRNSILKLILDILKKYHNRLISINSKLEECEDMDKYKIYGELITANLYRLSDKHLEEVELENYYENNKLIKIPLDIKYSTNVNAKRYFKKYTKLKNAYQIVTQQKKETEAELNYIESIVYELENCTTLEEVQDIFEEISENVVFKEKLKNKEKKKKISKKKKHQQYSPILYEIDGNKIYVGRNNKENDWLTTTFAVQKDIWFHTKDIQGSHVILKTDKLPDEDLLVKCAQIAAKHSKANMSSNVPVDYCQVQFVKKLNGAKPGMVIFTNNKTINVNPRDLKEEAITK